MILLRDVLCQIELFAKVNPDRFAPEPVSQNLLRQLVTQAGNENGNDLRVRGLNQFANARLRPQIGIRIAVLVARAFRMKADNVPGSLMTNLSQTSKGILIELALLGKRLITAGKERRIHRPPTHDQIHEHSGRRLIEEAATHRKEKLFAEAGAIKQNTRDREEVKKRSVISHQ